MEKDYKTVKNILSDALKSVTCETVCGDRIENQSGQAFIPISSVFTFTFDACGDCGNIKQIFKDTRKSVDGCIVIKKKEPRCIVVDNGSVLSVVNLTDNFSSILNRLIDIIGGVNEKS